MGLSSDHRRREGRLGVRRLVAALEAGELGARWHVGQALGAWILAGSGRPYRTYQPRPRWAVDRGIRTVPGDPGGHPVPRLVRRGRVRLGSDRRYQHPLVGLRSPLGWLTVDARRQ